MTERPRFVAGDGSRASPAQGRHAAPPGPRGCRARLCPAGHAISRERFCAAQCHSRAPHPRAAALHQSRGESRRQPDQTVYASHEARYAARTASALRSRSSERSPRVRRAFVTLHVRSDVVEQHSMEAEWYVMPPNHRSNRAIRKLLGALIIAVGTSGVRTLRVASGDGRCRGLHGSLHPSGFSLPRPVATR